MPTAIESPVFCDEAQKMNLKKRKLHSACTPQVLRWGRVEKCFNQAQLFVETILDWQWAPYCPYNRLFTITFITNHLLFDAFFFKLTSFTNCFSKQAGLWGEWLSNYQKQIQQTHTVAFCPRHQPALGSLETFSLRVFSLQNLRLCSLHTSGMIQHLQN